ncbi:glycosyltransferase family 4 protein [Nitrosopumilus sp.]|uniref:glycosyltransferase family 4 protein n=1 Tax=Nitrosopumilus sp. TaxID=2024843 RepID=UPI00247B80C2|nr:glycosyltransferase family 4 protein [Nitrosopumilus sp.]MCV0430366.1 glycosyltransferase family 4 protein [Nitrosopumilus sp.]
MKILFISPRFSGGIGGHAKRVADKLNEYGYEVKLMKTTHIPIKKLKNPSFAAFSSLRAIIQNEKFDIVHAFNFPSAFAMKYTKAKKKVLSIHGIYSDQVQSLHSNVTAKAVSSNELKVLKWADKLTTDSKAVKESYKKKLGIDLEFLYAPLDTKKFEKIKDVSKKENQIAFIGRDSYEKGIDILKNIESRLNGNVVYCTDLDWENTMSILKSSSVLVVPSRMESIPQVIKEAFYLKIPVIATNVGGIPELITNEENGLLVEPENSTQLIETINNLLSDKDKARKIGQAGYNFVIKNLTWEVLLPKYTNFYENLLKEN